MNDKELLELAAKAADYGFFFNRKISDDAYEWKSDDGMLWQWNPLMDDGQALRLAVKLNIRFVEFKDTIVESRAVSWTDGTACCSLWEPEGNDLYAATRRAIVRAAAEIGKSTYGTK